MRQTVNKLLPEFSKATRRNNGTDLSKARSLEPPIYGAHPAFLQENQSITSNTIKDGGKIEKLHAHRMTNILLNKLKRSFKNENKVIWDAFYEMYTSIGKPKIKIFKSDDRVVPKWRGLFGRGSLMIPPGDVIGGMPSKKIRRMMRKKPEEFLSDKTELKSLEGMMYDIFAEMGHHVEATFSVFGRSFFYPYFLWRLLKDGTIGVIEAAKGGFKESLSSIFDDEDRPSSLKHNFEQTAHYRTEPKLKDELVERVIAKLKGENYKKRSRKIDRKYKQRYDQTLVDALWQGDLQRFKKLMVEYGLDK
ncbi:hypothetical protein BKI52_10045 [marine bacterium AO1-C]|nr:hypothetical protein BKI52_10045 [marine bacterium AO1-C]